MSVSVYVCVALFVASVMHLECLYESLCLVISCVCVSVFYNSVHLRMPILFVVSVIYLSVILRLMYLSCMSLFVSMSVCVMLVCV